MGRGIENASVLVQHLGLVLTMWGALAAERHGHLTTMGGGLRRNGELTSSGVNPWPQRLAHGLAALVCGMLAMSSWRLVDSEREAAQVLAYGIPVWWVQASMPLGFALLGVKLGARCAFFARAWPGQWLTGLALALCGAALVAQFDGTAFSAWPAFMLLCVALFAGAPIFAVLGGLALALFWQDGMPLASVSLRCPCSLWQAWCLPAQGLRSDWALCLWRCWGTAPRARYWRPHCCALVSLRSPVAAG
jgi:hypothetical protein